MTRTFAMTFTQQWIGDALRSRWLAFICIVLLGLMASSAFAHAVTAGDKGYIQEISGVNLLPFMYLGAKHMMTGYDHILFLFGVI
ncbi:MAG: HupE/UreJ family protein, partial [Thiobacillus sp.]